MAVTGIKLQEISSGGATAPEGQEFKQAYFAEHPSLTGMFTISIESEVATDFAGDAALISELETAQANAGSGFFAVVYLVAPGSLIAANVAAYINDLANNHEVSSLFFLKDADAAFASAVDAALASQEASKRYFEAVLKYRKAYQVTPTGAASIAANVLTLAIATNHDLKVGDQLKITSTGPLAGVHAITAVDSGAGTVEVATTESSYTWAAEDSIEELPSSYASNFKLTFENFSSSSVAILAPTTQDNWMGALGGRLSKIKVQVSAGKVLDGGLKGVGVDSRYDKSVQTTLDEGRGIFFKRFVEDPSAIYVNDDLVMHSAIDSVTSLAQRRVLNKAKREILLYAFPLINDNNFNQDEAGALAAAQIAGKGLKKMKEVLPGRSPEIVDYQLSAAWTPNGISIAYSLVDVKRIKIVDATIELTN